MPHTWLSAFPLQGREWRFREVKRQSQGLRVSKVTPRAWLHSALPPAWKAMSAMVLLARQGEDCPGGRGRVLPVCRTPTYNSGSPLPWSWDRTLPPGAFSSSGTSVYLSPLYLQPQLPLLCATLCPCHLVLFQQLAVICHPWPL